MASSIGNTDQKRSLALAFPLTQVCPSFANLTTVPDLIRSRNDGKVVERKLLEKLIKKALACAFYNRKIVHCVNNEIVLAMERRSGFESSTTIR